MAGTLLNFITVAIGTAIGLLLGNRLPARIQESVMIGLGFVSGYIGISNAGLSGNIIIPLISIVVGVIIGELLDLHGKLGALGGWLERRFAGEELSDSVADEASLVPTTRTEVDEIAAREEADSKNAVPTEAVQPAAGRRARFIQGFVTASLLFCVGPLTFVGAMQDGMGLPGGFQQLAIKSVLDLFGAMAFAASLGIGVAFSLITILVVQGGLALAGSLLGDFMTTPQINEMTATGGLIILGISITLLNLRQPPIRLANFLPALVIAPVLVGVAGALGINIYPL